MENTVQVIVEIDGIPQIYLYDRDIESIVKNHISCATSVSDQRIAVKINTPPKTHNQLLNL